MPVLHRDIETCSALNLKKVGAWRYAADPSTSVHCVGYAVDDGPVHVWIPGQPIPEPFISAADDSSWIAVAHNDMFETAIETHVLSRLGWPIIPIQQHVCTMAAALANAFPRSLEGAAMAAGLSLRKDPEGYQAMLRLAKPGGGRSGDLELLYRYNAGDVEIERALHKQLPPLSADGQANWILDQIINARGFYSDVALAIAACEIVKIERAAIKEDITKLTDGKITSPDQVKRIKEFVQASGHQIDSLNKRDVAAPLAENPGEDVRQLLEDRRRGSGKAASKFKTLLTTVGSDRRVRGTLIFHGAATGRWSGSGFQPQNLAKRVETKDLGAAVEAILARDIDRVRTLGAPITVAGDVSRAAIIAAPGHVLIGADFSAIESRVLAWLAGEMWKLDAYREYDRTGDPKLEMYCVLAARALKREVTPADTAGRDFGKTYDLAFGFGGGIAAWRKFDISGVYTDAEIDEFKTTYRREHPATVRLWNALECAAARAISSEQRISLRQGRLAFETRDGNLYLSLPSGRCLSYPQAKLVPGKFEGRRQVQFRDNASGRWADSLAWRGTFTENAVQAIARDLLAAAMHRLEGAGYKIVLHCHDEVICEVPEGFGSEENFRRIMEQVPAWAEGLPVVCKSWTRRRYAKTKAPIVAACELLVPPAIVVPDDPDDDADNNPQVTLRDLVRSPIENDKVLCPFHNDHTPSCHLYEDHFYCFSCGARGDTIDWLMFVNGLNRDESVALVENWDGPVSLPIVTNNGSQNLANAHRLWEESRPIASTLAEQYLANRGIDVANLPISNDALRFHPQCPFGGTRHPSMVALFRDVITDAPAGIHRTALTADGQKIDRMSLGRWSGSRAIKLWPANGQLFIGEGIETVLAAATRLEMQPAWAAGSASNIAKFAIVPSIEQLRILVDNDETGRDNAKRCAKRWNTAGRTVRLLIPREGKDFNDLIRSQA
jgi:DNA polymerase